MVICNSEKYQKYEEYILATTKKNLTAIEHEML